MLLFIYIKILKIKPIYVAYITINCIFYKTSECDLCRIQGPNYCWTWSCCLVAFSRTICTLMSLCEVASSKVPSSKVAPSNLAPSDVFSLGTLWSYFKQCIFYWDIHEAASSNVFQWKQFMIHFIIIGNTFVYKPCVWM